MAQVRRATNEIREGYVELVRKPWCQAHNPQKS